MRKSVLWMLAAMVVACLGADRIPTTLVRLTVVNKSGMPVEIRLSGQEAENFYYLRIGEGSRLAPTEKVFTVAPDAYAATVYFIEPWDPVYGATCSSKGGSLDVHGNVRLTVLECTHSAGRRGGGEPPAIVKLP